MEQKEYKKARDRIICELGKTESLVVISQRFGIDVNLTRSILETHNVKQRFNKGEEIKQGQGSHQKKVKNRVMEGTKNNPGHFSTAKSLRRRKELLDLIKTGASKEASLLSYSIYL